MLLHGVFKHDELAYSCQTASKMNFLTIVSELRLFTGHETVNCIIQTFRLRKIRFISLKELILLFSKDMHYIDQFLKNVKC